LPTAAIAELIEGTAIKVANPALADFCKKFLLEFSFIIFPFIFKPHYIGNGIIFECFNQQNTKVK
jgi:hypothetical protein